MVWAGSLEYLDATYSVKGEDSIAIDPFEVNVGFGIRF